MFAWFKNCSVMMMLKFYGWYVPLKRKLYLNQTKMNAPQIKKKLESTKMIVSKRHILLGHLYFNQFNTASFVTFSCITRYSVDLYVATNISLSIIGSFGQKFRILLLSAFLLCNVHLYLFSSFSLVMYICTYCPFFRL